MAIRRTIVRVFQHAQARRRPKLEAAVRRPSSQTTMLARGSRRRCSAFPSRDPVTTLKPFIAPLVPDWRKENSAVAPVRREDGEDWQLQQVSEVVRFQSFAHSSILLLRSLDKQEASGNILEHSRRPWSFGG